MMTLFWLLLSGAFAAPSIVMVLTDDLDAGINGYDGMGVGSMSQLNERVVKRGAVFENYVIPYPLCSPSRSTMLTGRLTHNTKYYGNLDLNASGFHPFQEATTVNTWFTSHATALIGKYMNGYHAKDSDPLEYSTYIPTGWTNWMALQTVDFFGPRINMNGVSVKFPNDQHQTDILANLAAGWISAQKKEPYFALITPHAPHAPYTPPVRYATTPVVSTMPKDKSVNEADMYQTRLPGTFAELPLVNETQMDAIFQNRSRCMLAVDDMVGLLLDVVDLSETYFFFASDNGYHLGHHRLPPGKREIFDHDVRVPLVVAGPGIVPGVRTELVGNYDLAPTWADLVGIQPLPTAPIVDGRSFAAVLRRTGSYTPRVVALQESWGSCEDSPNGIECSGRNQSSTDPDYIGLFKPLNYTFATFPKDHNATMLFDNAADPDQIMNIAPETDLSHFFRTIDVLANCVGPSQCP